MENVNSLPYATMRALRGNPKKGVEKHITNTATPEIGECPSSIHYLMKDRTSVMENATSNLIGYIQRSSEFETQKAGAISVMATARTKRNYDIVKACECAADCDSTKRLSVYGQPPLSYHSTTQCLRIASTMT